MLRKVDILIVVVVASILPFPNPFTQTNNILRKGKPELAFLLYTNIVLRSVSNPIPTVRTPSQAAAPRPPSTASFHDKIQEFTFASRPPSRASLSLGVAKKKPSSSTSTASSASMSSTETSSSKLLNSIPSNIHDQRELTHKASSGSMYAPHLQNKSENRTMGSSATLHDQDRHQQQSQHRARQPVSVNHEDDKNEQLDVSDYLIPCPLCSRKFMETRLVRLAPYYNSWTKFTFY